MTEERFEFSANAKKKVIITLVVGAALFIVGAVLLKMGIGAGHHGHDAHGAHEVAGEAAEAAAHHGPTWWTRVVANLWINNVYFTGIALIGVFWIAIQYIAQAGWSTVLKRIPESFGFYLPVGGVLMLLLFFLGGHDIFHWTAEGIMDPESPNYDSVIAGKAGYLNTPFFLIRMVAYFALWFGMYVLLRKQSLLEDELGGLESHNKSINLSAVFLLIFGVTSSTSAWDWVLSIDTHWFSTMFGWYTLASWLIASVSMMILIVVVLKENGYMKYVTNEHLHDLGKFQFGFSIFWTYIWFSQFILIWYSNIPEESVYFVYRFEQFKGVFFVSLLINFFFPFLVLMTHESKRQTMILKIVSVVLIFGHWLDFYMMVMPGTVKSSAGIGLVEIGGLVTFFAIFIFLALNTLSKNSIVVKNHPFLDESLHHHV